MENKRKQAAAGYPAGRIASGLAVIVVVLLSACASAASGTKQKTDLLDSKGAALNIPTPEWLNAYMQGGNVAVEAMPEYKNHFCFVITDESADKAFLLAWVNNLNGPAAIASVISTTVSQDVAARSVNIEGEEHQRNMRVNAEAMTNASYTGARKVADWWVLAGNRATRVEYYQGFVLYIIEKQILNDQIARNLQNIADNNTAMSEAERAIYADLIREIRVNGFAQK